MLLKVINLRKKILNKTIFSNISFEIDNGDIVGILGPNGSGKTIFLKTLLGIFKPTEGEIIFQPSSHTDYYLNNNLLFPELNITNNIKTYSLLKNGRLKNKETSFLIDLFGLRALKNTLVRKLSAGEKQRLSLLISLINYDKINILILDEPFNFIDQEYQKAIMDFILELQCAKIVATHHTELLGKYFSKVIHFQRMNGTHAI